MAAGVGLWSCPQGGLAKKGVGPGDELNLDVMDGTIILINSMMV